MVIDLDMRATSPPIFYEANAREAGIGLITK
jgi:hypothetical protein